MLSNESINTLKKIEDDNDIDGLVDHITNIVILLKMDNSSADKIKHEKKPRQVQKELEQFAKSMHNLSAEAKAHLAINGFNFPSFDKAVNTPYIREKTNQNRNIIIGKMELIYEIFPDLMQGDLKETCLIALNESNYEAKNLKIAAYNMVKHITSAY